MVHATKHSLVGFYECEWTRSAVIGCLYLTRLLNRVLQGFSLDQVRVCFELYV